MNHIKYSQLLLQYTKPKVFNDGLILWFLIKNAKKEKRWQIIMVKLLYNINKICTQLLDDKNRFQRLKYSQRDSFKFFLFLSGEYY